ncbi:hypothetical protein O3Q51_16000 [Cryomorphaceae bacterium 1068]|nr:hypothetical protein [Cryomorphaceae bacterium 1068]
MNDIKLQQEVRSEKKSMNRLFIFCIGVAVVILIASLVFTGIHIMAKDGGTIFHFSAICIMTLWIAIIIGYYAWAIYFYNINLGLTNEDWAEARIQKSINPNYQEREENPNKEHTLGLPPGTVRGTLTLTLMVAALALTIAYMGEEDSLENNRFFLDNFDFFKQAFLMMIAFYFGSKSLEYISKTSREKEIEITKQTKFQAEAAASPENIDVNVENIDTDTVEFDSEFDGEIHQSKSEFDQEDSVG